MINYENGREKMLLSVDVQNSDTDSFWAFPVPASPEEVTLDLIDSFPRLYGRDFKEEVEEKVTLMFDGLRTSQIYFFVPLSYLFFTARSSSAGGEGEVVGISRCTRASPSSGLRRN